MIGSEKKLLMNINKFFLLTYQIGGVLKFPRKYNPLFTKNILRIIIGNVIRSTSYKHTTSGNFIYILIPFEMIKKKVEMFLLCLQCHQSKEHLHANKVNNFDTTPLYLVYPYQFHLIDMNAHPCS